MHQIQSGTSKSAALLTQQLPYDSGVALGTDSPSCLLAMSSSTTPTVSLSSATPSASQSQASDGGGGPSSSLYLYGPYLSPPQPVIVCSIVLLSQPTLYAHHAAAAAFSLRKTKTKITTLGSRSSRRCSYCYSCRPRLSSGRLSCAAASGAASRRPSSRASFRPRRPALAAGGAPLARNRSCGRRACVLRPTTAGTPLSYVAAFSPSIFDLVFFSSPLRSVPPHDPHRAAITSPLTPSFYFFYFFFPSIFIY